MGNAYSTEIREILNKKYLKVFMLLLLVKSLKKIIYIKKQW